MLDMKAIREYKRKWALSLKVGDIVCDCKYRHIKIKSIKFCYSPKKWIRKICYRGPLWLVEFACWLFENRNIPFLTYAWGDATVELEDGSFCSTLNCLDDIERCKHD